jgi:transposase-like protein
VATPSESKVGAVEYPGTWAEFLAWFPYEAACARYLETSVEPGATVVTDGWSGYRALPVHGYSHTKTILSASGDPAHVAMPAVHRVASLDKRWLLGTHHGSISPQHLDAYLGEFTFRFNRRSSRRRGLLFYRLLEQAVITPPMTYKQTIRHCRGGDPDCG